MIFFDGSVVLLSYPILLFQYRLVPSSVLNASEKSLIVMDFYVPFRRPNCNYGAPLEALICEHSHRHSFRHGNKSVKC